MAEIRTRIISIDAVHPETDLVSEAAKFITSGELVVFPTETVYGIGANALDDAACRKIFEVKGRPSDNPLIVHVSSFKMAKEIGEISEEYEKYLQKAWPCPITVIAKAAKKLPKSVTAGLDTVAIRMPAHPVALALIERSGVPIAAPSANPSKKPSATNASHAEKYFKNKVACIIDSGSAFFGVESTIIDLTNFALLRPGPFTVEEITKLFGKAPKVTAVSKGTKSADVASSPGTKYAHYAPDTPLCMFDGKADALIDLLYEVDELPPLAFLGSNESSDKLSKEMGLSTVALGSAKEPYEIAKNLYDGLILLDSLKVSFAITETFPETGIGLAIMNRLRKAASGNVFKNNRQLLKLLPAPDAADRQ